MTGGPGDVCVCAYLRAAVCVRVCGAPPVCVVCLVLGVRVCGACVRACVGRVGVPQSPHRRLVGVGVQEAPEYLSIYL